MYITELVEFLNANQGVIALVTLVVTIIGFLVVNSNIKVISNNYKTQKAGKSSKQTMADHGSVIFNSDK